MTGKQKERVRADLDAWTNKLVIRPQTIRDGAYKYYRLETEKGEKIALISPRSKWDDNWNDLPVGPPIIVFRADDGTETQLWPPPELTLSKIDEMREEFP